MSVSAYTKAQKKQTPLSRQASASGLSRNLEQSLLALESACMLILDSQFTHGREDEDGMLWQRKFKNIVTPISIALREYKGPRRFHFHYKHRKDDEEVLTPVFEDPLENLVRACKTALTHCENDLVGISDDEIADNRDMLETALRGMLSRYKKFNKPN
jgi:hypothetical protein